ncbi:MAG: autotransporter outer membrane beta-barrel domain-containing protein [Thermomicrobiales bacterium]
MTELRQTDAHTRETTDTTQRIKRRGLIAGAAALVAVALTKQETRVGAFSNTGTFSSAGNGYNGSQDNFNDGIQGYTQGANWAGIFGRNNDSNGVGVFGIAANGVGVFGQSSNGAGVSGHAESAPGVYGEATAWQAIIGNSLAGAPITGVTTTGITGKSASDAGVFGVSYATAYANAVGVTGFAQNGVGVSGKSPTSAGIWGFTANTSNTAAITGVSYANTSYSMSALGNALGVLGQSGSGVGVQGVSSSGTAVYGNANTNYGVYGASNTVYGVLGTSVTSHGVVGTTGGGAGTAGVLGYVTGTSSAYAGLFYGPTRVVNVAQNAAVLMDNGVVTAIPTVNTNVHGVVSYGQSSGYGGVYGVGNVAGSVGIYGDVISGAWAGYFRGAVHVQGDYSVSGTKSALVPFPDGSHRLLYSMESPEAWFEDFGEANLVGGTATVALDADFAAVVDTSKLYVFLTPHFAAPNMLAVTARSAKGFTVTEGGAGKSSGGFTYRVVAKRKDVTAARLAKSAPMAVTPIPPLPTFAAPAKALTLLPTPPTPTIPPVPHHAEEDAPVTKPTGAVPRSVQVAATGGDTATLPMTRQ